MATQRQVVRKRAVGEIGSSRTVSTVDQTRALVLDAPQPQARSIVLGEDVTIEPIARGIRKQGVAVVVVVATGPR